MAPRMFVLYFVFIIISWNATIATTSVEEEKDHPVWPDLKFGWRMTIGSLLAILGAGLGSVGGLGGGGIFVPALILVVGFDAKTAPALSKCMIMAQTASSIAYNIHLKRATSDSPLIDYELALLFQPMLLLGISLGVIFNVMFPAWLITALLVLLKTGSSSFLSLHAAVVCIVLYFSAVASRTCWRGVDVWRKETRLKARLLVEEVSTAEDVSSVEVAASVCLNVKWKSVFMLLLVWSISLILQLLKANTVTCSGAYWTYNILQVPVALCVTIFQAYRLRNQTRDDQHEPLLGRSRRRSMSVLFLYSLCGIVAGVVGGLLGSGGGAITGPAMLEFGASPQEASATAVFVMLFSSSLSVVEYYLLDRFPVPHAIYFGTVCILAAYCGQKCIHSLVLLLGRTSIIVFVLVFIVLTGGISLGAVGIMDAIDRIQRGEYMGFQSPCS